MKKKSKTSKQLNETPDTMLSRDTSEITIMLSDFVKTVIKMQEEQNRDPLRPKAAYITIYIDKDEETGKETKSARFDLLECSGLGAISFDIIDEITKEQLWNIP